MTPNQRGSTEPSDPDDSYFEINLAFDILTESSHSGATAPFPVRLPVS